MSNYMWYEATASSDDKDKIKELGFCFADDNTSDVILFNEQYEYELVRMYVSDGHGIVDVDVDNFYFAKGFPLGEGRSGTTLTINAIEPMTTPVKSYKIRMTDKYPGAQWFYFSPDQEDVLLANDTWMYLYEPDGTPAQDIYYRGMELEALNPIQSEDYEYSRFNGVEFGFRQHGGVGQLSIKFDSVVDNTGDEWPYGKRIRVLVTEPAPALPTVTTLYLNLSHSAVEVSDTGMFGTGYTLYYENGDTYSESTIPLLGAVFSSNTQWSPSDVSARFELTLRNNKVVLDGKGSYSSYVQRIEICADTGVTVITVYDSSNNPYNAFKYTSDGTDYYYVLDGTQTDWTDDLSVIGYRPVHKAYVSINKTDAYLFRNTPSNVYDSDGNTIPYIDANLLGVFKADGTSLGTSGFQLTINGGLLALNYYGGSGTYAGYAEYTIL